MKQEEWFKSKRFKESRMENAKKGSQRIRELKLKREQSYLINPKLCKVCQKPLPYKDHNKKEFCSKSCAAKYNNKNRTYRPSKDKHTKIMKCVKCGKEIEVNIRANSTKTKCITCRKEAIKKYKITLYERKCIYCKKDFKSHTRLAKYCSYSCGAKHGLETGKRKPWQSRNIKSYPEKFFEEVLINNKLSYEINKPFKGYFLDFYFADKNIDLEIDGKQHGYPDRAASDLVRDKILKKNGIKVFRIKWKSINTEDGKNEIRKNIQNFLDFYKNA
jgi:very-short-patch-repair endonuclease